MDNTAPKKAVLYRMVLENNICPFGVKAKDLLKHQGYEIEEHLLTTREEVDKFKEYYNVITTPQTFINNKRIGGYDDLQEYFGNKDLK